MRNATEQAESDFLQYAMSLHYLPSHLFICVFLHLCVNFDIE